MKSRNLTLIALFLGIGISVQAQQNQQRMKPEETEVWTPVPRVVSFNAAQVPSDAVVLFDGKDLSQWISSRNGEAAPWKVEDGAFTVVRGTGDIKTKALFTDFQLHLEWKSPAVVEGDGQGRGNSGVFMQGLYEVQILDSYQNETYVNGQAASIYKQSVPLVNATKAPTEWQTYDIIWTAPRFNADGMLISKARITVIHNGVLVQNNVELSGPTEYIGLPKYKAHGAGPIVLQDHGNPVSFRNIWIRAL